MKNLNFAILFAACSLMLGFSSCSKVKGCMDPASPNFNIEAEKEDGSCMSPAEALAGTWNVTETESLNEKEEDYTAVISVIDDNTVLVTTNRSDRPFYAPESFELEVDWDEKTVNGLIDGTIDDMNKMDLSYLYWGVFVFRVDLEYSK